MFHGEDHKVWVSASWADMVGVSLMNGVPCAVKLCGLSISMSLVMDVEAHVY